MDKPAADKGKKHYSERLLELSRKSMQPLKVPSVEESLAQMKKSHLASRSPKVFNFADIINKKLGIKVA